MTISSLPSSSQKHSGLFADSIRLEAATEPIVATIFGAPLDRTTSFRSGTSGGPVGVREMSWSLESYSPILNRDITDYTVVDLGNLTCDEPTMLDVLDRVESTMYYAAEMGRLPIMIGGEHTISCGGYRAIKRLHPDAVLVQADAHLDFRESYEGELFTHASWAYHAANEHGFNNLIQVGVRSGAREEWVLARDMTAWSGHKIMMPDAIRWTLDDLPVYLTIDIDVLDPACAPGTGCPEPGGCTFRELTGFLHQLQGVRLVGLDIVEVAPDLDHSGITSVAAAKLIREAILLFGTGDSVSETAPVSADPLGE